MLRRGRPAFLPLALLSGTIALSGLDRAAGQDRDPQSVHDASYLRAGAGARGLAMGGAFVAVADDAAAGYWNPAGLTWICGWQMAGTYSLGLDAGRRYSHIGIGGAGGWGACGLTWLNARVPEVALHGANDENPRSGSVADNALMLSLARQLGSASLGLTAKGLIREIEENGVPARTERIHGYGIDLGLGLGLTETVRAGFAVQNIAGELGGGGDADDLPATLRAGLSLWPMAGVILAADVEGIQEGDRASFHIGGEYDVPWTRKPGTVLRAGATDGGFALGIGVGYGWVHADYAYVNDSPDFLDESHQIGISLTPGQGPMARSEEEVRDADHDGIPDGIDQCSTIAEDMDGFLDADGCPDPDNDGDGVLDANDDCPGQAEDGDGWQDSDGCPEFDNDADGIPDKDDNCPDVPETVNGHLDGDGCPDEAALRIPALATISFKRHSAEIDGADPIPILEDIARILRANPGIRLKITGHTDSIGGEQPNARLSVVRAEAVKSYLMKRGISGDRLTTAGRGEGQPIDTNDTEIGRARNRRIEFSIVR